MESVIKPLACGLFAAALIAAPPLAAAPAGAAQPHILYRFTGQGDGGDPIGAPVLGNDDRLFGLTSQGGAGDAAVVYSLRPLGDGTWKETVLHNLPSRSAGVVPFPSLTIDRVGDLFGTLSAYSSGVSDVFELAPPATPGAGWTYQVLAHFPGPRSPLGDLLTGSLLIGRQGEIFGIASAGGDEAGQFPCDCGLVYSLTRPTGSGNWPETVLSVFHAIPDGDFPYAGLTFGPGRALFGATYLGGAGKCLDGSGVAVVGCGTLFTLNGSQTSWTRTTLHSFSQKQPSEPTYTLTLGPDGALYGFDIIVAYRFAPPHVPGGRWYPSVIHTFPGGITGTSPVGAPVFDAHGNMYGMTRSFGIDGPVTLFKLTPPKSKLNGPWRETELGRFPAQNLFRQPTGGLAIGRDGTLYGAIGAGAGGDHGYVFAFKP